MNHDHRITTLRREMRRRRDAAALARVLREAPPALRDELMAAATDDSRFVTSSLI